MKTEEEIKELLQIQIKFLNKSTCEKEFIKGQINVLEWVLEEQE